MRLVLVRHGQSMGNVTQVLQTRDEQLTDRGRRQAREIAAHLAAGGDVRVIYASPLARAFETSQIIGVAVGVTPEPREGLAEIDVGDAAGLTFEEWTSRFPDEARRFHSEGVTYTFPGGESGLQLGARTAAEIDRIIIAHRLNQDTVVVVSHGGALAWIVGHLLGEASGTWPRYQFDNCSLTEFTIDATNNFQATLVRQNEIGHLTPNPDEEVATGRA